MCIYDSALDSPPLEMEENFLLFNLCTTLGLIFFFFFYLSLRDLIKENLRFEKLFDLIFFYKFNFKWCYYFLLLFFFFSWKMTALLMYLNKIKYQEMEYSRTKNTRKRKCFLTNDLICNSASKEMKIFIYTRDISNFPSWHVLS